MPTKEGKKKKERISTSTVRKKRKTRKEEKKIPLRRCGRGKERGGEPASSISFLIFADKRKERKAGASLHHNELDVIAVDPTQTGTCKEERRRNEVVPIVSIPIGGKREKTGRLELHIARLKEKKENKEF